MSPMQWVAIGLGTIAVLVISIDYGRLPWIALTLATSFTIYGVIKKQLGSNIGAVQTMTFESLMLAPFAFGVLIWIKQGADNLTFGNNDFGTHSCSIFLGLATILPLSLFTSAATRLPLVTMGMLQFLAPIGTVFGGSVRVRGKRADRPLDRLWIRVGGTRCVNSGFFPVAPMRAESHSRHNGQLLRRCRSEMLRTPPSTSGATL